MLLFFEISRIESHVMLKPRQPCFCLAAWLYLEINTWAPRALGSWGEGLFIFRELGCTGNYFRNLGSKLNVLRIFAALQKSKK